MPNSHLPNLLTERKQKHELRAEIERLKREHCAFAYEAGERFGAAMKENAELKAGGGLVVHALDRAIALTEQLFIFLPEGTVLPPAVATCKHMLDEAMRALGHRRETWRNSVGNTSSPTSCTGKNSPSTPSTTDSASGDKMAGSLSPSPATTPTSPSSSEPSSVAENVERWRAEIDRSSRALSIAGQNIVTLSEQRSKLTSALSQAALLIEELLTVMRQRGVTPSGPVVVTKARLDQQMRELFEMARKDHADN